MRLRHLILTLAIPLALIGAVYAWYRCTYPYGAKHACLKCLGLSLEQYARDHAGHYPTGEGCPEASLSLLYQKPYEVDALILSGKTKSTEAAQKVLERGELLGPDTCDWHYVEGLTQYDDRRLAIVWDKIGLGNDGQRLSNGGHSVWRVGCGEEVVPESEWPAFLQEQDRLMAARTEAAKKGVPALSAKVRLPSGEIVDHYDAQYTLQENWSAQAGPGRSSAATLDKSVLESPDYRRTEAH